MTDLFTRLARRKLGTAQLLSPQVPGLFEPQVSLDDGFVEEDAPQSLDRQPAAQPAEDPPTRTTPQSAVDHILPDPLVTVPLARREPPHDAARHDTVHEHHFRHDHIETTHKRVTETQIITQDVQAAQDDPPQRETPEHVVEVFEPAAQPIPDKPMPTVVQDAVSPLDPPLPVEPVLPPPRTTVMSPVDQPTQVVPQPPERRVDVHIGHLEIRAPAPSNRKPRTPRTAANPAPDLNTYLGGRR